MMYLINCKKLSSEQIGHLFFKDPPSPSPLLGMIFGNLVGGNEKIDILFILFDTFYPIFYFPLQILFSKSAKKVNPKKSFASRKHSKHMGRKIINGRYDFSRKYTPLTLEIIQTV